MPGGTITVSRVEQTAVLSHMGEERGRLAHDDLDGLILDSICRVLKLSTTVQLSRIEATTMLRYLRHQRERMAIDVRELEERRLRGGHNGHLNAAQLALDTECVLLDDVIRRLWSII